MSPQGNHPPEKSGLPQAAPVKVASKFRPAGGPSGSGSGGANGLVRKASTFPAASVAPSISRPANAKSVPALLRADDRPGPSNAPKPFSLPLPTVPTVAKSSPTSPHNKFKQNSFDQGKSLVQKSGGGGVGYDPDELEEQEAERGGDENFNPHASARRWAGLPEGRVAKKPRLSEEQEEANIANRTIDSGFGEQEVEVKMEVEEVVIPDSDDMPHTEPPPETPELSHQSNSRKESPNDVDPRLIPLAELQQKLAKDQLQASSLRDQLAEIYRTGKTYSSEGFDAPNIRELMPYVNERVERWTAEIGRRNAFSNDPFDSSGHSVNSPAFRRNVAQVASSSASPQPQLAPRPVKNVASSSTDVSNFDSPHFQAPPRPRPPPIFSQQAAPPPAPPKFNPPNPPKPVARPPPISQARPQQPPAPPTRNLSVTSDKGKGRVVLDQSAIAGLTEGCDFDDDDIEVSVVPRSNGKERQQVIDDDDDDIEVVSGPSRALSKPRAANAGPVSVSTSKGGSNDPAHQSKPPTMHHPWSKDVSKVLRQRFRLQGFRPNQEEAINATLAGKDVFVLLPTGGGKSLCFQLPACVSSGKTQGVTIVISPLISLVQDQCTALSENNIPVISINSSLTTKMYNDAMNVLRSDPPKCHMVYLTPEKIAQGESAMRRCLAELYQRNQIARFVIDEAHCVSSWGHTFRADYKALGFLRETYPRVPIMALTATATPQVKLDVENILQMRNPLRLTSSFNRSNLTYEVKPKKKGKGGVEEMATYIKQSHMQDTGIIYCHSRNACEETALALQKQGIKAHHFHAWMDKDDKKRTQAEWQSGKIKVVCATIAFGMGIDKANVRYVLHQTIPKSLEGYYQETGRAGRDGKPSVCVLYYSWGDAQSAFSMIDRDKDVTKEQRDLGRLNLQSVVQFCMNQTDCRRTLVLAHFDEKFTREQCKKTCDSCLESHLHERKDVTPMAQDALRLVKSLSGDNALGHVVDVFRGSQTKKIIDLGQNNLPFAGKGASWKRGDVERLFQLLIAERCLAQRYQKNGAGYPLAYLMAGPKTEVVLSGRMALELTFKKEGAAKAKASMPKPNGGRTQLVETDESDDDDEVNDTEEITWATQSRPAPVQAAGQAAAARAALVQANKQPAQEDWFMGVYKELDELRQASADSYECAPEAIISDSFLSCIASGLPTDSEEFNQLEGEDSNEKTSAMEWWLESGSRQICLSWARRCGKIVPKDKNRSGSATRKSGPSRAAPAPAPPKSVPSFRRPVASTSRPKTAPAPAKAPAKAAAKPTPSKDIRAHLAGFYNGGGGSGAKSKAASGIKAMPMNKPKKLKKL